MTARGIRYKAIRFIAVLLCTLMMLPAVFSLLGTSSYAASANDINVCSISDIGVVYYTVGGAKPLPEISYGGEPLTVGKDFTVSYKNNNSLGTAYIIIKGKGSFFGSIEKSFTIKARPIIETEITVSDIYYNSNGKTPKVGVSAEGRYFKEGTDYFLIYENTGAAGASSVRIVGTGKLTGSEAVPFNIMRVPLTQAIITCTDVTYTGSNVCPKLSVIYRGSQLKENTDFTISLENNTDVGTATVLITGIGNYSGVIEKQFNITKADISKASIEAVFSEELTDYELSVKYEGMTLVEGKDYSISVTENGSYIDVTITGIGNFTGTLTKSIKVTGVTKLDMAEIAAIPDQIYTGEYIRPDVSITYNGVELVYGADYYLTYENNKNAGTTVITVTGTGSNAGTVREVPFVITPFDINDCKLLCDNTDYTGAAVTPVPKITFGNYSLQEGKDFVINSYTDNINEGNGSVSVSGMGNYCGTADIVFTIVEKDDMQELIKERMDEMMEGLHDRQINDYVHSYKLGNYFNTYITSACTCHSYCNTGYESGCSCLIGRSTVLGNSGIQCAGFTMEVFQYLFGETNGDGENTLTTYNRSEDNWTEAAIRTWMISSFRPGDYMAYDNITYGYPHYIVVYSVESDGIWVYEANYGGRCKINKRKITYSEIYNQFDGIYHRTPNNYKLSDV